MQKVFSPSSLNCFENCAKQYHFRYVEKRPVETESIEAFVGKRVHEVLERLHLFVADGRVPSLERVIQRFHTNWDEQFDAERVRIVRSGMTLDFYRGHGVRCIQNYYRRAYPFETGETVALERGLRFALDEAGEYPLRGIIDKLVRAPDGALEIHDYKTSQRAPRQAILDRDRQLGLYELGVRKTMGEEGVIRLVWDYVAVNQVRVSTRTPEQLEELRASTRAVIDSIRLESDWEPHTGPLCDWCEYRDACPAFAPADAPVAAAAAAGPAATPAKTREVPPVTSEPPDPLPVVDADGQWRLL